MNVGRLGEIFLALMILIGAVACGGGDTVAEGGIGGTGITGGTVTGFGSIFVNGVEFDTSKASITVDGMPSGEANLGVGMFVRVYGSRSADGLTGVADRVEYADELEGIVTDVTNIADGTVEIMGQTVHVTRNTVFVGKGAVLAVDDLEVNMVVEVSGYPNGLGEISATRIEVKSDGAWVPGPTTLELKGIISKFSEGTFSLGTTRVRFTAETDMPPTSLREGLYVEVQSSAGFNVGELVASAIELENGGVFGITGDEGESVEMAGIITTALGADNVLSVNGQQVLFVPGITTLPEGKTFADLTASTSLEVEGVIQNGRITAQSIEIARPSEVEVLAPAQLNPNLKTVTLLGLTFQVTNRTVLPDDTATEDFWLTSGSMFSVQGYNDVGTLVATRVEVRVPSNLVELEGKVTAVNLNEPKLEVYGVAVSLGTITNAFAVGGPVHVIGHWDELGEFITAESVTPATDNP